MNNVDNNYNFPVALQPIFFGNGQEIQHRKVVVRTDTMQPLSVVSNEYGLVKHSSVIDTFREASSELNVTEKISLTNNGGNLFYEMLFPTVEAEVKKGDLVRLRMIIKNSYDGKASLQVVFGALRLVCLNGMVIGSQFFTFQFRHTKILEALRDTEALDPIKVRESLTQYIGMFGKSMKQVSLMAKKPMQITDGSFDKEQTNLPAYLMTEAQQEFENSRDKSVWGYYNALTFAITHKAKKQSPSIAIDYGMKAWRIAEGVMQQ